MANREYKMTVVIQIDDERRNDLIDKARHIYRQNPASGLDDAGMEYDIPPEEHIASMTDSLMELIHSCFDSLEVEVDEISCTGDENESSEPRETAQSAVDSHEDRPDEGDLDELDEFETGVYLCRWPNGEFSVVTAESRREAILMLDEWGGAHPSYVHPIDSFMADFGLTDQGGIELLVFGEGTSDLVWKTSYPDLNDLLLQDNVTDNAGNLLPQAESRVRDTVAHEKSRLWHNQPIDEPSTDLGKSLARQMGTSAVVADSYVRTAVKKILKSKLGEGGRPN